MTVRRSLLLFIVSIVLTTLLHCSFDPLSGGGSDLPDLKVSGTVVDSDNTPAIAARIMLLPTDYDPVKDPAQANSLIDTTDKSGRYTFSHVKIGHYTIQAVKMMGGLRAMVPEVQVFQNTNAVPVITLQKPGTIKIAVPVNADALNGYYYIPGTTIYSRLSNNNGYVILDSVPANVNLLVYYGVKGSAAQPQVIADTVHIQPGSTTAVEYVGWKYSKKILLNTTAGGADIAGTVTNFPVLIRLNNGNFNFAQASVNGSDMRFAKENGEPISYEIEEWDSANGKAEIWVKVDTVYGNSDTRYVAMLWGNSQAENISCDSCVFSISDGWAGVWHLAEGASDSGVVKAAFRNSVENANHGDDSAKLTDRTGIIGNGQAFLGAGGTRTGDKIVVPGATSRLKPKQLTLSAWVKAGTIDVYSSEIASMGDNYLLRIGSKSGNPLFILYWGSDTNRVICGDSLSDLRDSTWHHVTGSYDGAVLRLYVDGTLRNSVSYSGGIPYSQGTDFVIGSHGAYKTGYDFTGAIDEVECSGVARSPDWIRLCYMSQKITDALVTFEH